MNYSEYISFISIVHHQNFTFLLRKTRQNLWWPFEDKALAKRRRQLMQVEDLGQLATSFGQGLRALALTCDDLRSLWSRSNLHASRRKFFTVWPPNASLYASSTCVHLRLLACPFGQGFREKRQFCCKWLSVLIRPVPSLTSTVFFWQEYNFTKEFYAPPVVMVTANHLYDSKNVYSIKPENNVLNTWIEVSCQYCGT